MTYELRDFSQTAVDTALSAGIIAGDITLTIDATTGWPTGGANGPFFAMIDYDVAGKELVLVTSRTGNTLQNVARGQGGTPAAAHSAGAKIRHIHTARDADEANYAVSQTVGAVTTKGDILAATAANTLARRPVGANNQVLIADSAQADGIRWGLLTALSLGTDSVGADELANSAVDNAALAANAVTTDKVLDGTLLVGDFNANVYGVAGSIAAIDPDDAANAGVGTTLARIDHQHPIATVAPSALTKTSSSTEGAAATFVRSDHLHSTAALPWGRIASQRLTSSNGPHAADANTDMVLSPTMDVTRAYVANLHTAWDISAASTWIVNLTEDGVKIAEFDITDQDRDIFSGGVYFEPTGGAHTYRVHVDLVVAGGTITLGGAATAPRLFWIEDIGAR